MAHAREAVRKAVVTAVTGLATTGSRVVSGQLHTQAKASLPALAVEVCRGRPEQPSQVIGDECGDTQYRQLPVDIVAMVQAVSHFEDSLDDICCEVETAIFASSGLAAVVRHIQLLGTEIEISGEGDRPVGTARMQWLLHYGAAESAPTVPL